MCKLTALLAVVAGMLVTAPGAAAADFGGFITPCPFSHRSADDPIVHHGHHGASHMHDFLGNSSTDAHSTLVSLLASPSLCKRAGDHSAYWVPTFYENGVPLRPYGSAYYLTSLRDPKTIGPFPQGLRVIAGDPMTKRRADPRAVYWHCTPDTDFRTGNPLPRFYARRAKRRRQLRHLRLSIEQHRRALRRARRAGHRGAARLQRAALRRLADRRMALRMDPVGPAGFPTCPAGRVIHLTVSFPSCWDGTRLDSRDHKSHLAYPSRPSDAQLFTCPSSHPHPVPNLVLSLKYPTRAGPGARLVTGGPQTAHADFFNAWEVGALAELVGRCVNADVDCGTK
jgi:hypothetical protein